jgi:plastocyanin
MLRRGTAGRRIWLAVAIAALGAMAYAGIALAADSITAADNSYNAPSYTMNQGEQPSFANGGANQHNVTARQNGPDGKVLFSTPTLNGGQSATVDGTQYLTAGTYTFFCTIHPTEMQATLVVTSSGTPQARPHIDLRILSSKLAKVKKKAKILVQVTASTSVSGASVEARLGPNAILGRTGNLSLQQGAQTVAVKLTKRGKRELRPKTKARISVDGSVPFGQPASVKRKLR